MEKKMGEEKDKQKTKKYEITIAGENTQFKINVDLTDLQFRKFISFLMTK